MWGMSGYNCMIDLPLKYGIWYWVWYCEDDKETYSLYTDNKKYVKGFNTYKEMKTYVMETYVMEKELFGKIPERRHA